MAGATRHTCLLKIEPGGENTGSNSHFEAILGFFGKGACFHAQWPLFKTPFALWCLPLAPYTQAIKKTTEIVGFWRLGLFGGCRMTRAYFLMKLASRPLRPCKISAARAETGVFCTRRRSEPHPDA